MSNSKSDHPVGSRHGSSDRAEWSCVAGLKLRYAGRERCCPGHRQRQPRFSDRDWPEKSNPRRRMGPKIPTQGVGKCTFGPGPGTWLIIIMMMIITRVLRPHRNERPSPLSAPSSPWRPPLPHVPDPPSTAVHSPAELASAQLPVYIKQTTTYIIIIMTDRLTRSKVA